MANTPLKILVLPRDPNPYQELLYSEVRKYGSQVAYLGGKTRFPTVNLMLLPIELMLRRAVGYKIVHIHWVWAFSHPANERVPGLRRLTYAWFLLFLRMVHLLGMKLAWTAHNVLPHDQVFPDDIAGRKLLARHSEVVFGHSEWTLAGLTEMGAKPRRWASIRHPSFGDQVAVDALSGPSKDENAPTQFLFFGKIFAYKGVEELLEAFAGLPRSHAAHLTIAGECTDPQLRARIESHARRSGDRVSLRFGVVPDSEVGPLMESAHVAVLPFRQVTTSGSAILALSYGKPLIVPTLPSLADLPRTALYSYDGTVQGLTDALATATESSNAELDRMRAAALAYAAEATWPQVAEATVSAYRSLFVHADAR